jgi:hypothetical protein
LSERSLPNPNSSRLRVPQLQLYCTTESLAHVEPAWLEAGNRDGPLQWFDQNFALAPPIPAGQDVSQDHLVTQPQNRNSVPRDDHQSAPSHSLSAGPPAELPPIADSEAPSISGSTRASRSTTHRCQQCSAIFLRRHELK